VVDGSFGGGWSIFFGAEHNHKQKDQKDAKTDKNSGINNFLHAENDDFCFGTHGGDLRGCLKLKKERNSGFSLCHSFYDILEASSFNDGKTEIDKEEEEMEKTRLWRFS
jgi:hypothetical protein